MITNEIKAKIFAQYLGQKVWYNGTGSIDQIMTGTKLNSDSYKLILKPLSSISDEDAVEVAKMCYYFSEDDKRWSAVQYGKQKIKEIEMDVALTDWGGEDYPHETSSESAQTTISIFQFLQSKGYDLPNFLLDGKTLHESGLAIYENEK